MERSEGHTCTCSQGYGDGCSFSTVVGGHGSHGAVATQELMAMVAMGQFQHRS